LKVAKNQMEKRKPENLLEETWWRDERERMVSIPTTTIAEKHLAKGKSSVKGRRWVGNRKSTKTTKIYLLETAQRAGG